MKIQYYALIVDLIFVKMKNKIKKTYLIIGTLNILLLIYLIVIGIISYHSGWKAYILSYKVDLVWLLLIMFIFELLSTITFQFRIWLTSRDKITLAAFIGGLSWLIAGIQGLLLINGTIEPFNNDLISFVFKIPSVFVATVSGILINTIIKRYLEKR